MNHTITATELKNNLGKYLDYVIENHEVVVTKNGQKAVRISPYLTDHVRYFLLKEQSAKYQAGDLKVSYEEFMEIYEKSDLRLEFLDGEITALSSPSAEHQLISGELFVSLRTHFKETACKVLYAPFDIHIYKEGSDVPDVLQPDLVVACDLEENTRNNRYMGVPMLVVEILSPTTRSSDMVDKLRSYMLSGIQEYWIVDPENRSFLVYAFENFEIVDFKNHTLGATFQSPSMEGLSIEVSGVFGI